MFALWEIASPHPNPPPPSDMFVLWETLQSPLSLSLPLSPLYSLLKVVATHLYQGEDDDELSFEKGATIYVIPYDDPDDEV